MDAIAINNSYVYWLRYTQSRFMFMGRRFAGVSFRLFNEPNCVYTACAVDAVRGRMQSSSGACTNKEGVGGDLVSLANFAPRSRDAKPAYLTVPPSSCREHVAVKPAVDEALTLTRRHPFPHFSV